MLWLTLACANDVPYVPPPPVPASPGGVPTTLSVPTLFGEVQGVSLAGDWTSAPCGGRTYARNIRFETDQQYGVVDLVSPCPVGTTCTWSGMIGFGGLWEIQGLKVVVQELAMVQPEPGGPHPVRFEATADGKLYENGCFYEKGLTVPPGYEEDKVRPKISR